MDRLPTGVCDVSLLPLIQSSMRLVLPSRSYALTSKRGNRDQFASMISSCHKAGVKVIAGEQDIPYSRASDY